MSEKQRRLDDDFEWEVGLRLQYGSWRDFGQPPEAVYFGQLHEAVARLRRNEGRFTGGSQVEQEALGRCRGGA